MLKVVRNRDVIALRVAQHREANAAWCRNLTATLSVNGDEDGEGLIETSRNRRMLGSEFAWRDELVDSTARARRIAG